MRMRPAVNGIVFMAVVLLLVAAAVLSLSLGAFRVPPREVALALLGLADEHVRIIVIQLRLPRIVAALLVGAALGIAGALLQGVIRNPLASPEIVGITGGASVFVVTYLILLPGASISFVPFAAVGGAVAAALLNYVLAWQKGVAPTRLVMIGIGISTASVALTTFMLISGPAYLAHQLLNWTTGSLYATNWTYVGLLWPWIAVLLPLSLWLARELNVQGLGEAAAIGLGSRLHKSRLLALALCVALAGAAVGVAGTLSFIGLMAPHMARRLVGLSYHAVLPMSAILGALLLLLADLAGRMLFMPLDIPAGVFTAAIGAPFFVYLLYRTGTPGRWLGKR